MISFYPRYSESRVRQALSHMRVVAIIGPRQSGKTTLAKKIAQDLDMDYHSLDDDSSRSMIQQDPKGFIRSVKKPIIIDEISRLPQLVLEIKQFVDDFPEPGQFFAHRLSQSFCESAGT